MAMTTAKKEKEKKKAKAKQDKAQKMKERKENFKKGKSLEEMLAYVDENGNLSPFPPDARRREDSSGDMNNGNSFVRRAAPVKKGIVSSFNEAKGFGFITDLVTRENVFFHVSQLSGSIKKNDAVVFDVERNAKGISAVRVKKQL